MDDGLDLGKRKEISCILSSAELLMCFTVRMAGVEPACGLCKLCLTHQGRVVKHRCVHIWEELEQRWDWGPTLGSIK